MAPDPLLSHCNGYAPTSARVCCRDCDWFLTTAAAEVTVEHTVAVQIVKGQEQLNANYSQN
uniref:Uncharacterized protein n=1 Tax=Oryza glumipatula TaxID=40148 RepID=A0A0D9YUB8_9ORYZ